MWKERKKKRGEKKLNMKTYRERTSTLWRVVSRLPVQRTLVVSSSVIETVEKLQNENKRRKKKRTKKKQRNRFDLWHKSCLMVGCFMYFSYVLQVGNMCSACVWTDHIKHYGITMNNIKMCTFMPPFNIFTTFYYYFASCSLSLSLAPRLLRTCSFFYSHRPNTNVRNKLIFRFFFFIHSLFVVIFFLILCIYSTDSFQ